MIFMSQTDHALVLQGVSRTYMLGKVEVPALKSIDLTIARRRFTVIAGPSGSGKTTLLNIMGCIDRPSGGAVSLCGQEVLSMDDDTLSDFRAHKIGFIFQNFNLIPVLNALENVEYPLLLTKTPKAERRRRAIDMLESVGLGKFLSHRPAELSGGQRQRVAVARALVKEPEIILADEPTANLDSLTGQAMIDLMRTLQQERHVTFIFSSHDRQIVNSAEEVFFLRDGLLIEHRTKEPTP